jgi:hypothetical protein
MLSPWISGCSRELDIAAGELEVELEKGRTPSPP